MTLKKLASELNANNVSCEIPANIDKVFLKDLKDEFMAYIFEGDNGFSLVVRLKDENGKAINHKTYTPEQQAQCDEYKALLVDVLNEAEVYVFKAGKRKEIVAPVENKTEDAGDLNDLFNDN